MTLLEKMKSWFGGKKTGKVFCRYSHYLRKYIAFQVVKELGETPYPESIGVVFLDWLGDTSIQREDISKVRAWGKIQFFDKPVPRGFRHVFDAPVCKTEKSRGAGRGYPQWYNWDAAFSYRKLFGHLSDDTMLRKAADSFPE
jgi:hypothetical protein|nr:MAG TPA: hypothetical protein [Caudoviricetes sp.]